jgi:hypothetical protein
MQDQITKLSPEETESIFEGRNGSAGRAPSALNRMLHGMDEGEGLQVPCRWKHEKSNCSGASLVHRYALRHGYRVQMRCKDGMIYVQRLGVRE